MKIAGVILAGGQGLRMQRANKALLMLDGRPLFLHVAAKLRDQVETLGINANRDLEIFSNRAFHLPIVADGIGGNLGPLDGILGAMIFAKNNSCTHVLTVSVDTPFIPADLVEKLMDKTGSQIAVASSHERIHATCGLWPISHAAGLKAFMLSGKKLKVLDFLNETAFVTVAFSGGEPDPFFNINTPDDLETAARWLRRQQTSGN